jgi:RND family efflux transporter MFP subunit
MPFENRRNLTAFSSVALVALAACGPHTRATPAADLRSVVPIRTARASEIRRTVGEEVTGTVRAARSATLAPMVMGTVMAVRAALGDRVRTGDVLVWLSAREIDARLAQAEAVYAQAKLERDRSVSLRDREAIPRAQADAALAQFHIAEAAQAEARTMVDHTSIRAPFAGVVTAKLVEVGDVATPGRPLLVIEAPEPLRFEAMVPEAAAQAIGRGDRLAVSIDGAGVTVTGTIAEVSPSADRASRTILVKLDLPRGTRARPGMFGRVASATHDRAAVAVPLAAVVRRGQLDEVFVVEDEKARLRLVRTGREQGGFVELLAGVREGETVAIADAAHLVDGQPVVVQ